MDGAEYVIRYRYDEEGFLEGWTYPGGRVVDYSHDRLGRIQQVSVDKVPLMKTSFDPWGNIVEYAFASGARSMWKWDPSGRFPLDWTALHQGGAECRPYEYDAFGHLIRAGEWRLEHDPQGRLVRSSAFGMATAHHHDGFGNETSHALEGDVSGDILPFSLGELKGNRIPEARRDGFITGWVMDPSGQALSVGAVPGGRRSLGLAWDALGRLASVHDTGDGRFHRYRYAPSGMRIGLAGGTGKPTRRTHLYTDVGLLLRVMGGTRGARDIVYLGSRAIAEVDAEGIHELHADHLGTPRLITSGRTGALEGRQAFGPYGERLDLPEGTWGYRPLTGFTGHLRPDPTGLVFMRNRFYSPAWHRFLSPDHGRDPWSLNQFAYVGGRPFQMIDPTGWMMKIPRHPDGVIDGGGTTVPVYDTMPGPIPLAPLPGHLPPPIPGTVPGMAPVPAPHVYPGRGPVMTSGPSLPSGGFGFAAGPPTPYQGPAPAPSTHPRVSGAGSSSGAMAGAMGRGEFKEGSQRLVKDGTGILPGSSGPSTISVELGQEIAKGMKDFVGTPYSKSGSDKAKFKGDAYKIKEGSDCGGSVAWAFEKAGLGKHYVNSRDIGSSPHYVQVSHSERRAGDVIRWAGHVAIYDPSAPDGNDMWTTYFSQNQGKFGPGKISTYGLGEPIGYYRRVAP